MPTEIEILGTIQTARFAPDLKDALESFQKSPTIGQLNLQSILDLLIDQIRLVNPRICLVGNQQCVLPEEIANNNAYVREQVLRLFNNFSKQNQESLHFSTFAAFIVKNHESIKWSLNKWLLANPGLILEPIILTDSLNPAFLALLSEKFSLHLGDHLIFYHIISSNGRKRLRDMQFSVPSDHLVYGYFTHAMKLALATADAIPNCKGILSTSWMFNPENFVKASDNKPYAAFTFLNDETLVGHRIDVSQSIFKKEFQAQFDFAVRNSRRKRFSTTREFVVKVFTVFYPIEEMKHKQDIFI